jgi:DNA-binding transcriptional LysR family regulator
MDWENLKTFLAVARHGSLSAAARALRTTQSTMGRRLDALHDRAGVVLLMRTPAGYVLTEAGEKALPHAEAMEGEALAIERTVSGGDVRLQGLVRVATIEALAANILAPSLPRFTARYPGITFELDTDTRIVSLSRREADVAVRVAQFAGHEIVTRKVGAMAYGLYASRAYLERHGEPNFQDGGQHNFVMGLQPDFMHLPEEVWLRSLLPNAQVAFRSNSRQAHLRACQAGLGLAVLSRYLADEEAKLVLLSTPTPAPIRDLYMGVHQDTHRSPRMRAVIDHIVGVLDGAKAVLTPPSP